MSSSSSTTPSGERLPVIGGAAWEIGDQNGLGTCSMWAVRYALEWAAQRPLTDGETKAFENTVKREQPNTRSGNAWTVATAIATVQRALHGQRILAETDFTLLQGRWGSGNGIPFGREMVDRFGCERVYGEGPVGSDGGDTPLTANPNPATHSVG